WRGAPTWSPPSLNARPATCAPGCTASPCRSRRRRSWSRCSGIRAWTPTPRTAGCAESCWRSAPRDAESRASGFRRAGIRGAPAELVPGRGGELFVPAAELVEDVLLELLEVEQRVVGALGRADQLVE